MAKNKIKITYKDGDQKKFKCDGFVILALDRKKNKGARLVQMADGITNHEIALMVHQFLTEVLEYRGDDE